MNVTEWSVEDHVKRRAAREARGMGREVDVGVEGYTIRLLVTLRAREAVEKVGYLPTVGNGGGAEEGGEESAKGVGRVRWQTAIVLVLALACGVEKR